MRVLLVLFCIVTACTAPSPEGEVQEAVERSPKEDAPARQGEAQIFSVSNNPLISHPVDPRKLIQKKQAVAMQGTDKNIPDAAKLSLAMGAFYSQNWGELLLFLDDLTASRDVRVRSQAHNIQGVLALREGRLSEAVVSFQEALRSDNSNQAALLNLGFLNLRFGYFDKALPLLLQGGDDWFAKSGLIVIKRLSGDLKGADELCDEVLDKHGKHKMTLFNCGLLEFQSKGDIRQARSLIEKAMAVPGGEREWNAEAVRLLRSM